MIIRFVTGVAGMDWQMGEESKVNTSGGKSHRCLDVSGLVVLGVTQCDGSATDE